VEIIHEAPGDIFDEIHVALEDHGSPLIVSGDISMRLHETNQMDQTGRSWVDLNYHNSIFTKQRVITVEHLSCCAPLKLWAGG
jgi:hypothetical protein